MTRSVIFRDAVERIAPGLPYVVGEKPFQATGFYRPDYVELVLVTQGEGRRVVESRDGSLAATSMPRGSLHLFRAGDVHALAPATSRGCTAVCVAFPEGTWERFAMAAELDTRPFVQPEPPRIHIDLTDSGVREPFLRVLARFEDRPDVMDLVRFLTDTIPWFVDAYRERAGPDSPGWLAIAIAQMRAEENLRAGVPRLRELSRVSAAHLWRTSRACFGRSPSQLVTGIRIRHAAGLLETTDDAIADIAARCGFRNHSSFSEAFRREHQVSPRRYRALARAAA